MNFNLWRDHVKNRIGGNREMKRSFLEELGLTKEQIDSIMSENGNDINAAKADYNS